MIKLSETCVDGWKCIELDVVDSTLAYAQRMLKECPLSAKTAIVAHRQTGGYGRSGHTWESESDLGLWVSAITDVQVSMQALAQSTLVLAVAVQHAVKQATGVDLQIKWPNDLFSGDQKCAGLLVEAVSAADPLASDNAAKTLVLGFGLNVNQSAEDFSAELDGKATSLSMLAGKPFDKKDLLSYLLSSIDLFFTQWQSTGFAQIREQWLRRSYTIGRKVGFQQEDGYQSGVAVGMSDTGALEVRVEDGAVVAIDCGEIFFET